MLGDAVEQAEGFFAGPGAARDHARRVDWACTPLGPVAAWGAALRTAVRLCLDTRAPTAVWAGPALTLVHNDAYAGILGPRAAWAMGRPVREVWGEAWELLAPQFEAVMTRGESIRYEQVRLLLQRGGRDDEACFSSGLTPVRDDDGRVVAAFNTLEETTGTMRALTDSEYRYRALFDSVDEGFCIVEVILDAQGRGVDHRFIEANPAFERHTGLVGAIGRTARELVPDLEPTWPERYGRVAMSGRPERFVDHSAAMGRWFEVEAFRVGRPRDLRVALLFRDITERKLADEALRESRARLERESARLQLILDTIPVGLYILDAAGGALIANEVEKRIWRGSSPLTRVDDYGAYRGFSPKTGEPFGPEDWPAARALRYGIKIEGELVDVLRLDGTPGTLLFSAAPLRGEGGVIEGAIVAIQDISELRQAQARLEAADRQKDEFLAVLSHELRNPLAPVKNSLYVLRRVPPGSEPARRAVDIIERQVEQLTSLVNDLLDVTRITRGKVQLQRRAVEMNELARHALEDHLQLFQRSGVHAAFEGWPEPVLVDADWNRLSQVVSNLLQNAAKFTPRDGQVVLAVAADCSRGEALVTVRDSGVGMLPAMLDSVFEPFVQADATLDRSQGGLGLGLALVKRLVELHGGSVEAESGGPGQGALFRVRLPLIVDHAAEPMGVDAAPVLRRPRRVLVIDDNVDAAESLCAMLQLQGHEVAVARDGPEALETARAFGPEFVLCDIGLPGMDGYAVAAALRADPALRGVRLVAVSGYAQPEDLRRAAAAGFERHLAKPPAAAAIEALLASA